MKIKKILGIILCMLLVVGVFSGCTSNAVEKSSGIVDVNLEEKIIGSWNAGSAYMSFFENGEMGLLNSATGNGEIIPYEIEGDTIILKAKAATIKMLSVKIDGDTLTYTSEQGHKNVWHSVSNEEVMSAFN